MHTVASDGARQQLGAWIQSTLDSLDRSQQWLVDQINARGNIDTNQAAISRLALARTKTVDPWLLSEVVAVLHLDAERAARLAGLPVTAVVDFKDARLKYVYEEMEQLFSDAPDTMQHAALDALASVADMLRHIVTQSKA